jgi:prepilin-type processing-associated H-X9-DG protein
MLLPALRSARERAKQIQCLSQIKQCVIGSLAYAGDYSGYMPSYYQYPYPFEGATNNEARWSTFLLCLDYIRQIQAVHCPADFENSHAYNSDIDTKPERMAVFSYGTPISIGSWYRVSSEKNPSGRLLYSDSVYYMTYNSYNKWCHTSHITQEGPPSSDTDRTVHLRHLNAGNAAFVDGHAESLDSSGYRNAGFTGGRNINYLPMSF